MNSEKSFLRRGSFLTADESACHVRVHSVSVSEKGAQTATYLELDD